MTACGYTPAEIDDLPLPDVVALFAHWRRSPPQHRLLSAIAQWLGAFKPPAAEVEQRSFADLAAETADWFANPERFFAGGRPVQP